eukprot:TRINITY_DN5169_c0_g1_i10.p1 TRINITY_DN5169_c0_g1~~TRINITY_DN5169_c0_g1_i10.p1  ORF type:complete len:456 (-),score=69.48 TRINITY_DN5169_c0_g1_i10:134-1417(-)
MAGKRRKKRTHISEKEIPGQKGDPKTFVFKKGRHADILESLEGDIRKVMSPNTAKNLKVSKKNTLKDFVSVAGPLGVSHFLMLTATEKSSYLKISKTPRGPTITFEIQSYSLISDVQKSLLRPSAPPEWFNSPPLVVMNNLQGQEHFKLMTVLMQNMFPPLKVDQVKLSQCKRVVLFDYNKESGMLSLRHYGIQVAPTGVSKGVKALVQRKALPDLSGYNNISEFIQKAGYGSESEGEEAEMSKVTLPQTFGRGNIEEHRSRVRLQEIGPRLNLVLVKVQEGLCEGRVLYHKYIQKTPQEVAEQQQLIEQKAQVKAQRKQQQEQNVQKKQAAQEDKDKQRDEKKRKRGEAENGDGKTRKKQWWEENDANEVDIDNEDDDVEQFRQEVGIEPDEEFMVGLKKKKSNRGVRKEYKMKKRKMSEEQQSKQ